MIKVKKAGSIYLRVKASIDSISILTIKSTFSTQKTELSSAKAGDKGEIQFDLVEWNKAEIVFSAVVCEEKCHGSFTYTAIVSPQIDQIISHLVCTSVSFDFNNNSKLEQPVMEAITSPRSADNKISHQHSLSHGREYLGVKAVNNKTGEIVYYPPIELINFSGKMDKALEVASKDNNPYWVIGTIFLLSFCCVLYVWRRYRKIK